MNDRNSFDSVPYNIQEICRIKKLPSKQCCIVIVCTKYDLKQEERQVLDQEIIQLVSQYGLNYILTSSKTGHNVEEAFLMVCRLIRRKHYKLKEKHLSHSYEQQQSRSQQEQEQEISKEKEQEEEQEISKEEEEISEEEDELLEIRDKEHSNDSNGSGNRRCVIA